MLKIWLVEFMGKNAFRVFKPKEDALVIIVANYDNPDKWEVLSEELDRPEYVLIQRAFQLGAVKFNDYNHVLISHRADGWRSDELDFVIENAGKMSVKMVANQLGRTESSVAKQIYEFRLSYKQDPSWTDDELGVLGEITVKGAQYVAKETGRCLVDVKHQAVKQGYWKKGEALSRFPGRSTQFRLRESA